MNARTIPNVFLAGFLLLWTAVVGFFLFQFIWGALPQVRTYGFAETTGTVTKSELKLLGSERRKRSVTLVVEYDYSVDGRDFTGTRYVYGQFGSNADRWKAIQVGLPVGATVPVFYSTGDPADAVLHRGFMGFHLFVLWAMTPFTLIAVGGWWAPLRSGRPQFHPGRVEQTATGCRVRLPETSRLAVFLLSLFVWSLIGVFAMTFGLGTNPPVIVMLTAFATLLAVSLAVAIKGARYPVLDVDNDRRMLIPQAGREVAFDRIKEIVVHTETKRTRKTSQTIYHVTAIERDDGLVRLATYARNADAAALAGWLTDRVAGKPLEG